MSSAYDLYTFYLHNEHLRGRSVQAVIEAVSVEDVFNARIKRNEKKLVVRFVGKKLALCLNKTQCGAIIKIADSDNFSKWVGLTLLLTPTTQSGRPTITISKPDVKETPAGEETPTEA